MIYLLGTCLAFFLCSILAGKRGKTQADTILAFWLIIIGINLFYYYLNFSGIIFSYPYLLATDFPLPLLQGPMLFLYTASHTGNIPQKKAKLLLHFLPVLFSYILFVPFYILSNEEKVHVFEMKGLGWEFYTGTNVLMIYASGIFYFFWSMGLLKKHQKSILEHYSYTEKINLKWLKYLIYSIGLIWVIVLMGNDNYIYFAVVLFVTFIGYYGIKQVGIFTYMHPLPTGLINEEKFSTSSVTINGFKEPDRFINPQPLPQFQRPDIGLAKDTPKKISSDCETGILVAEDVEDYKKKYQKSGLNFQSAQEIKEKLSLLMSTQKTFKNPELTLVELAQMLNTHANNLSQVINSLENKNFYDYINDLRIEEFKKLVVLNENNKYTLLSLALDCGFNSKTSFNRNFKKSTGISPSDYIKSCQTVL